MMKLPLSLRENGDANSYAILDGNGNVLASKSKITSAPTTSSYIIPFDPPGYGLVLQLLSYRTTGTLAQKLITALIVLLGAAVLASLWAMRRHIERRLAAEQALRSEHAFRKAMEDSLTVGMRARPRRPPHLRQSGVLQDGRLQRTGADARRATDAVLGPGGA